MNPNFTHISIIITYNNSSTRLFLGLNIGQFASKKPVAELVPAVELRAYRYLREVLDKDEDGRDVITLSLGLWALSWGIPGLVNVYITMENSPILMGTSTINSHFQ